MEKTVVNSFDYMYNDNIMTHIDLVKKERGIGIVFENFTDKPIFKAFGNRTSVSLKDLDDFFEERCFPETRANTKEILNDIGLSFYDAYSICKITHGVMKDDWFWIRFKGETLTCAEARALVDIEDE